MDERQAIFEQLTLSDFNYSMVIMTNNNDKTRISCGWCFFVFELIQQAALVNFCYF